QQMQQFLGMVMADKSFFTLAPKEQFLQHLNDMFMTGILNRQNDLGNSAQSMKSLLIQLLQNSDGIVHDKARQFIHFLNGMHLQSIQETGNFLEATIQIPAERLGLNGDMVMELS